MMPLEDAAEWARSQRGPTRIWRWHEQSLAEVFFHRDLVVHGRFGDALTGLDAIRAIVALGPVLYSVDPGRWPDSHSLLIPWGSLLSRLHSHRPISMERPPALGSRQDRQMAPVSRNLADIEPAR